VLTRLDMAHFLYNVRQSMLSCRRVQPVPQDFIHALSLHQLTLHSLLPHLDPPVSQGKCQPPLTTEPLNSEDESYKAQSISTFLHEPSEQTLKTYIPNHFPSLPSQHTYRADPVYTNRERDPRKVRELATEEGRLGEEALRKLVAAQSEKRSQHWQNESQPSKRKMTLQERRQALWEETVAAVQKEESSSGVRDPGNDVGQLELDHPLGTDGFLMHPPSSIVNADRLYWRKPVKQFELPQGG
jgi:transcription initiation factor TFIID subunit 8